MPEHPGGADYIGNLLGKCIDEDFEEAEHTKFARKIFNDLPVRGRMKEALETKPKEAADTSIKMSEMPVVDENYTAE